jgi:predicted protein tyrosine phosphatase
MLHTNIAVEIVRANSDSWVRCAGTNLTGEQRVTLEHIDWADKIFLVEDMFAEILADLFRDLPATKSFILLQVPVPTGPPDPELIEFLIRRVNLILSLEL